MRILMMLTAGVEDRPSRPLGLGQVVEPYYLLHDAGAEVVVVSVRGGDPPFGGARKRSARAIAVLQRFQSDRRARDAISDTLKFVQIYPEDFDGGICIGALEEAAASDDKAAALNLITALLAAGKPVAIVPSDLLLAPQGPLEGLLIIGDQARSPPLAARALLAAVNPGGG
jgi:putative intracellular protease/amidase